MTVMLISVKFGKSKAVLQDALNHEPNNVAFHDPSIIRPRDFWGDGISRGESFPVVMDHPKRTRFALVTRKTDGSFKVT